MESSDTNIVQSDQLKLDFQSFQDVKTQAPILTNDKFNSKFASSVIKSNLSLHRASNLIRSTNVWKRSTDKFVDQFRLGLDDSAKKA